MSDQSGHDLAARVDRKFLPHVEPVPRLPAGVEIEEFEDLGGDVVVECGEFVFEGPGQLLAEVCGQKGLLLLKFGRAMYPHERGAAYRRDGLVELGAVGSDAVDPVQLLLPPSQPGCGINNHSVKAAVERP